MTHKTANNSAERDGYDDADGTHANLQTWLVPLRAEPIPPRSEREAADARARHVSRLRDIIGNSPQLQRRRARRQWLTYGAAAAVVFGVGLGFVLSTEDDAALAARSVHLRQVVGTVVATKAGHNEIVDVNGGLSDGDQIQTTAGAFASLDLQGEGHVDLSTATTMRVEESKTRKHRFHLSAGRVDVSVPPVTGTKRSLVVATPNAMVKVRGTIFSVEVVPSASGNPQESETQVRVTRGVVVVQSGRSEVELRAGQTWSSGRGKSLGETREPVADSQQSDLERPAEVDAPADLDQAQADFGHKRVRRTPARAQPTSDLPRQNELFAKGLRARDRGDHAGALRWFERLLTEFPDSPLRASTERERNAIKRRLAK